METVTQNSYLLEFFPKGIMWSWVSSLPLASVLCPRMNGDLPPRSLYASKAECLWSSGDFNVFCFFWTNSVEKLISKEWHLPLKRKTVWC
jgi:hypothetical protein